MTKKRAVSIQRNLNDFMDYKDLQEEWDETPNKGILPADVKSRMWMNIQKATVEKRSRKYRWIAAACAVFLLGIAGYQSFLNLETLKTEVIVTQTFPDDIRLLRLADGTRIWVNQNTKIECPDQFAGNERRITLQGEAYFEVAKDPSRPFIITSGGITTTVLGTSFNVKAYKNKTAEVRVCTGKVKVESRQNTVLLERGYGAVYQSANETVQKQATPVAEPEWKKALLDIDGLTLGQVFEKLRLHHAFTVDYASEDLKQLKIRGTLDTRQGFEEMLQTVAFVLKLEIKPTAKNTYVISR